MKESSSNLSARQKLAESRAELLSVLGYEASDASGQAQHRMPQPDGPPPDNSLMKKVGVSLLVRWWHGHPVHAALDLSRPMLAHYAQTHPRKLLAYSAGVGCLLVIAKPWKLLSFGAVFALLFKGREAAGIVSSLAKPAVEAAHFSQ